MAMVLFNIWPLEQWKIFAKAFLSQRWLNFLPNANEPQKIAVGFWNFTKSGHTSLPVTKWGKIYWSN